MQPSPLILSAITTLHFGFIKMKCALIPILTLLIFVLPDTPTALFYKYNATSGGFQLPDDLMNVAMLLEKDMKAGNKMKLGLAQSFDEAPFLPREVADSIPFSSAKLDDILNRFGVKPGSEDAKAMEQTLKYCEEAGIMGEEMYCATSLESMVDFATSKLGKKVEAISTEAAAGVKERGTQEYTIAAGVEKVGDENVVCHKMAYPHAVFYCHRLEKTTSHKVALEGTDGVRVKAVVICHADTSHWNPEHLFLRLLNVKPGTVTVCHSLPQNNIVWVPRRLQNPRPLL